MITAIFADLSTIYPPIRGKYRKKLDYGKVLNLLEEDSVVRAYAYSTQAEKEAPGFVLALKHLGYIPKFKEANDWHVELTLDVVRLSDRIQKAVFITNDLYYEHLFEWCQHRGIFVHLLNLHDEQLKHNCDQQTVIDQRLLES
jgi:hypothetical protein